jgi:hypothetical protein
MTRDEALAVMGLGADATIYDVEKRFTVLVKQSHGGSLTAEQDAQVSMAYSILTGQYVEPEVVPERLQRVVFGKTLYNWKNIWHYGRWTLLGTLLVSLLIGSIVYSVATNKDPDFEFAVIGQFAALDRQVDSDSFSARAFARRELGVTNPLLAFLPLKEKDTSEMDIGVRMQMGIILAGADPVDLFIANDYAYTQYAPSGLFRSVESVYESLRLTAPPDLFALVKPIYGTIIDSDGKPTGEAFMMGLDVTGTWLVEGLGVNSARNILCLGIVGKHPEKAEAFILAMFRDHEALAAAGKRMYEQMKLSYTPAVLSPTPAITETSR